MAIDHDRLMAYRIPDVEQSYTERDTMLYALGLGFGVDPTDEDQLSFVTEGRLQPMPTMAAVLAWAGGWARAPETGIDYVKVVHGEQRTEILRPLPVAANVVGQTRITGIVDKGAGKGALVYTERTITDTATGEALARMRQSTFCRGDGGFGGPDGPVMQPHVLPDRAPDHQCDIETRPEMALIYRLSGDMNPLHSDPATARAAGFDRPILHGLGTYGVAARAVVSTLTGANAARLVEFDARFTAPVFPGEILRTEMWVDGDIVSYRTTVPARGVTAINNGRARLV